MPESGNCRNDADRKMLRFENRPLFDMQFDKRREIVSTRLRVSLGIKPGGGHDLADRFSVVTYDGFEIGFGDRSPDSARSPESGGREPARFFLTERHDFE